jgi:hypothetical protein
VVFEEAKKLVLIGGVGAKVEANTLRVFVLEAIVKSLVVAKVEAVLLEFPLEIPVGLGDK